MLSYEYNGKLFDVDYVIVDLNEGEFDIFLFSEDGEELSLDDLPSSDVQALYELVDQDAQGSAVDASELFFEER